PPSLPTRWGGTSLRVLDVCDLPPHAVGRDLATSAGRLRSASPRGGEGPRYVCWTLAICLPTRWGGTWLRLLDACDLFQGCDPLLDRWVCLEEAAEEGPVVLLGVVDAHRRDRVVELLGRLVVGADLLQRVDQ